MNTSAQNGAAGTDVFVLKSNTLVFSDTLEYTLNMLMKSLNGMYVTMNPSIISPFSLISIVRPMEKKIACLLV